MMQGTTEPDMNTIPVKCYKISLDEDPSTRWRHVIIDNLAKLTETMSELEKMIPSGWLSYGIEKTLAACAYAGLVMYSKELYSISELTGISIGKLIILQLYYELNAHCTSILTDSKDGVCLTRTMDWQLSLLKDLTIQVEFISRGKVMFKATTWVGCVGIFTGMKPGAFAISLNYRRTNDSLFLNIIKTITYSWPSSFLIREVLTECNTYNEAVNVLSNSELIAPCYLTIASADHCDDLTDSSYPIGCILIRDRDGLHPCPKNPELLKESVTGYIVQTNNDKYSEPNDDNILYSRERVKELDKIMNQQIVNDPKKLMEKIILSPLINNEETIYITQMKPRTGEFKTIVFV